MNTDERKLFGIGLLIAGTMLCVFALYNISFILTDARIFFGMLSGFIWQLPLGVLLIIAGSTSLKAPKKQVLTRRITKK